MREIDFIAKILPEMAEYARERYADKSRVRVESKTDPNDLLTEVDLTIQKRVIERINAQYPGDHIAAEESGKNVMPEDASVRCWILDPIDGTQNFVRGIFPMFGISIAFAEGGRLRAGGVVLPVMNHTFLAESGAGATRNGERLRVSTVATAFKARVEVDFSIQSDRQDTIDRFSPIICTTGQVRCFCSAVVSLCSISTGDLDAYVHVGLAPWDYAASQLIVEEAGGRATRLDGSELNVFQKKRGILATNALVHEEYLALLRKTAGPGR
jgi:myo-inositol-1(or 4)-monophosphatase